VRTAARRDLAEDDIVTALRGAGYTVHKISDEGIPDLLVSRHGAGKWLLLEVKSIGKTLTKAQEKFFAQTEGCPRYMVTTAEDALKAARYWLGGHLDG
jgi:hypothetical protein